MRPALPGSYEQLFGELPHEAFVVEPAAARDLLGGPRLERAIGVIIGPRPSGRATTSTPGCPTSSTS